MGARVVEDGMTRDEREERAVLEGEDIMRLLVILGDEDEARSVGR